MLTKLMTEARTDDFRRAAAQAVLPRDARAAVRREAAAPPSRAAEAADVAITIRPALPRDTVALARLATLDSVPMPAGAVLIAEADGQLRAALSLCDGASVADPFHPTAATVQLLVARAAQLGGEPRRRGFFARVLGAGPPRRRWRAPLTRSI
ncbi:MAG: hypothetical protein ACXVSL_14610 [Solirubrobacteraceae bacterium]